MNAPAAEATPLCPGQLELFRVRTRPHIIIDYALLSGSENAVQGAITGTLRWLTADGK